MCACVHACVDLHVHLLPGDLCTLVLTSLVLALGGHPVAEGAVPAGAPSMYKVLWGVLDSDSVGLSPGKSREAGKDAVSSSVPQKMALETVRPISELPKSRARGRGHISQSHPVLSGVGQGLTGVGTR